MVLVPIDLGSRNWLLVLLMDDGVSIVVLERVAVVVVVLGQGEDGDGAIVLLTSTTYGGGHGRVDSTCRGNTGHDTCGGGGGHLGGAYLVAPPCGVKEDIPESLTQPVGSRTACCLGMMDHATRTGSSKVPSHLEDLRLFGVRAS